MYTTTATESGAQATRAGSATSGPTHGKSAVGAVVGASVLFRTPDDQRKAGEAGATNFFGDLNFDQLVAAITASREVYDLSSFFAMPLQDVDAVAFRHEVMRDLEKPQLLTRLKAFAAGMHVVRDRLAQLDRHYAERQKHRWFLDAANFYAETVKRLVADLLSEEVRSHGLAAFRDHAREYAATKEFIDMAQEAKRLEGELAAIRYSLFTDGSRVEVSRYHDEANYTEEVEATFARFRQGEVGAYKFSVADRLEMNHVEERILEGVASIHPETFSAVARFRTAHAEFLEATIAAFDREIQFYIAYLDLIAPLKEAGLPFCYPTVSTSSKEVSNEQGFDLALALKLARTNAVPVCNDFKLEGPERIMVVSGPNQGGKTTFARTFGQLHLLAGLGYPVPGTKAQLFLADRIFAYFEREEHMTNHRGKLEDDLVRVRDILAKASPRSVVIINELFSSTSLQDAVAISRKIAAALFDLDVIGVWVTFLDELASLSNKTVSMVSTVVPENPALRTFKIVRRPADGLAYAMSIAEKYRLTHNLIRERIGR